MICQGKSRPVWIGNIQILFSVCGSSPLDKWYRVEILCTGVLVSIEHRHKTVSAAHPSQSAWRLTPRRLPGLVSQTASVSSVQVDTDIAGLDDPGSN